MNVEVCLEPCGLATLMTVPHILHSIIVCTCMNTHINGCVATGGQGSEGVVLMYWADRRIDNDLGVSPNSDQEQVCRFMCTIGPWFVRELPPAFERGLY